jgi:hypothetical protein
MFEKHSTSVGDVYCGCLAGGTNENVQEVESQNMPPPLAFVL